MRRLLRSLALASLVALVMLPVHSGSAHPGTVTLTKHITLGFNTVIPVSANPMGCLATVPIVGCIFSFNIAFTGTAFVSVNLGADLTMTYDPTNITPGGTVPVHVTYTPTPGASSAIVNLSGTEVINVTGCLNCPATLAVTLVSGGGTFTAPLGSVPPIIIPGSSSTVTFEPQIISASLASALLLTAAPASAVPGLGGATAVAASSPNQPLEWDSAGQTLTTNLMVPVNPAGGIALTLSPIVQWLGAFGGVSLNLHWGAGAQVLFALATAGISLFTGGLSDPAPITVFSGGLGSVFSTLGLDTQIGNAIGGAAGPLVVGRVAAGFVPVPLVAPPLATVPPTTLGTAAFTIPAVSIAGAPASAILLGTPVHLSANVAGATPPLTFAWTKNGQSAGGGASLTDTPALGDTSYGLTVTDSTGAVTNTAAVSVHTYDFTVAITPLDSTVILGGTTSYTVSTAFVPNSTGSATATLSVTGLPLDATTSLPASIAVGTSTSFTITTGLSRLGDVPFHVVATTSAPRSASAMLHIYDFSVVVTPASATVMRGGSATYLVSVPFALGSGGAPTAALSITGQLPTGVNMSLPASIPVGNSTNLVITTSAASSLGDFPFQVVATTSVARSANAALHTFDFTISLDPPTQTVPVGGPASLTLSTMLLAGSSLVGLPATIATTLAGVPTAAAAIGFPTSEPLSTRITSTTFTVNTSSFTPTGNYTLTATGTASFGTQTGSQSGTAVVQVISIGQAVQNLISSINSMGLPKGVQTSLEATLKVHTGLTTDSNAAPLTGQVTNGLNATATCNKLDVFLAKVSLDLAKGELTAAQAANLTGQAALIETALGCE